MIYENEYLEALSEINNDYYDEKNWLLNNFELYKLTLSWPKNLPPINRTDLLKGTLREKFNSTFMELLSQFEYKLNNKEQTLEIESTNR